MRVESPVWIRRTLVIDNYDSFTWNLVHLLEILGDDPVVVRPAEFHPSDLDARAPARLLISPGPGRPRTATASVEAIARCSGRLPVLGVCLGAQCLAEAFGGATVRAPRPMHGKTSLVEHDGRGCFAGLPARFEVMRYHSLVADGSRLPAALEITATTGDGIPMGLRHRVHPTEGIQFHPESFLTEHGMEMIESFLSW